MPPGLQTENAAFEELLVSWGTEDMQIGEHLSGFQKVYKSFFSIEGIAGALFAPCLSASCTFRVSLE